MGGLAVNNRGLGRKTENLTRLAIAIHKQTMVNKNSLCPQYEEEDEQSNSQPIIHQQGTSNTLVNTIAVKM